MKFLFIAFLVCNNLFCSAQPTKKVKIQHQNPEFTEEFYVLKSDENIKQGKYVKIQSGAIVTSGYYKNNLQDSSWIYYFPRGTNINLEGSYKEGKKNGLWQEWQINGKELILRNKGVYKNGERFGAWQYSNTKGEIRKIYDFSTDQVYFDSELDSIAAGSKKPNSEFNTVDHPPKVLNTESENDYLNKHYNRAIKIVYPEKAMRNGIHGLVVISFVVDENGNEKDYKVLKGIGYGCDEEGLRVTKAYPFKWHPALKNGKPVSTTMVLPLRFSIRGL